MKYIQERKFAVYFALIVVLITLIPYVAGFAAQGEDWRFTGFVMGVEDGNSYIAKMLKGAEGDWLFRSSFSSEGQKGFLGYFPYILLGKLASPPAQHDQLVVIYQVFRIVSIFAAVFASWDFIGIFIENEAPRKWALAILILGGGLGWILVITRQIHFLGSIPLDFISPESFGFLEILGLPHLNISRALLLWGLVYYLKRERGYISGLLWLVMGLFQPMVVVISWAVIGSHILLLILSNLFLSKNQNGTNIVHAKKYILKAVQAVLVSSPIIVYSVWAILTDPYLRGWSGQLIFPSLHFFHYLIGYGLLLPLTFMGVRKIIYKDKVKAMLIAGWIMILPILIYAPVGAQRRLTEGAWVAIVLGAVAFFDEMIDIPKKWIGYLLMVFPSTLFLLTGSIDMAVRPREPVFRSAAEVNMFNGLRGILESGTVILASYETSNNIPAWIPVNVVLGHGPESINREKLDNDIELIFSNDTDRSMQLDLLFMHNVDCIIWGKNENEQWSTSPEILSALDLVYKQNGNSVYCIEKNK